MENFHINNINKARIAIPTGSNNFNFFCFFASGRIGAVSGSEGAVLPFVEYLAKSSLTL